MMKQFIIERWKLVWLKLFQFGVVVTKVKAWVEEWVERMSWDSNTLPQVCEKLECIPTLPTSFFHLRIGVPWISNFWDKCVNNKWFPNWAPFRSLDKVLKCKYKKWGCIFHLETLNSNYGKKKGWESNWFLTIKTYET